MAVSPKKSIRRPVPKPAVSGAVGGPSTGAGLNYQIDYAVLRILRLCAEFLSRPLTDPAIQIEPRVINDSKDVTRWDLGFEVSGELIEAKLSPSKQDLSEWINRAKLHLGSGGAQQFVLVYSKAVGRRLLSLKHLMRIADEAGPDQSKFTSLVELEEISESQSLLQELGDQPRDLLQQMKLVDLSETSLSEEVALHCDVLAGAERGKDLRDFLFSRVSKGLPHRATLHIRELIETAASRGIALTPMPMIAFQGLESELRDALLLLSVCTMPVPAAILASAVDATPEILSAQLTSSDVARSVMIEDEAWRLLPSPAPLPKADPALCEKGLRALLAFVGDHKYEMAGRKQVTNVLAVAQICLNERPHEVARMFVVLDKAVKGLGDKHLVLKAAEMAITAARRALPRRKEEVEGEAQAMICGESWALQRIGRLQEAMIAAEKSLKLGQDIGWDRNTAYCEKCMGRLYRIMAEGETDKVERERLIKESAARLQAAIWLFSKSSEFGPTHPEVGDCYSLLGRTWLVGGDKRQAADSVHKASNLIDEPQSKDYLDLRILQGELLEPSDRDAAAACYEEVLQQECAGDSERSEIAARAYFRRAINRAAMGRKTLATNDFQKAKELWEKLEESENSARASWEVFRLDGLIPQPALSSLSKESVPVRVAAIQIHQDRLNQHSVNKAARRAQPATEYWLQLIKDARSRVAVESRQW